jgi:hypothetical protein
MLATEIISKFHTAKLLTPYRVGHLLSPRTTLYLSHYTIYAVNIYAINVRARSLALITPNPSVGSVSGPI